MTFRKSWPLTCERYSGLQARRAPWGSTVNAERGGTRQEAVLHGARAVRHTCQQARVPAALAAGRCRVRQRRDRVWPRRGLWLGLGCVDLGLLVRAVTDRPVEAGPVVHGADRAERQGQVGQRTAGWRWATGARLAGTSWARPAGTARWRWASGARPARGRWASRAAAGTAGWRWASRARPAGTAGDDGPRRDHAGHPAAHGCHRAAGSRECGRAAGGSDRRRSVGNGQPGTVIG